eukprot:CAMPEP_0119320246 /NCGR_PEP_ID=MMETSP1333-20130426/51976_1 /TAXON_ID=418940 /ORGANISM="Scyphosphaera apsteinii, Strain RCC1455" /LENGTH=501 /DNA_ID=CAMNT_0007326923 /DNA_START=20 /DNA_END=1525 /DNA_ORIENTATION=-
MAIAVVGEAQEAVLSDDEVLGEADAMDEEAQQRGSIVAFARSEGKRNQRGMSKRAVKRAAGNCKHMKPFDPPLPLKWKALPDGGGYQEYRLPANTLVYRRREYKYADEEKVGQVNPVRPGPPSLFSEAYSCMKAKSILAKAADEAVVLNQPMTLQCRLEARIVRAAYGYFIRTSLDIPPAADTLVKANEAIRFVFGDDVDEWTLKMVMARGWPELELTGDTLAHYRDNITDYQRSTQRLLSICFLGLPEGASKFKELLGVENRLENLEGSLKESAVVLADIVRNGSLNEAALPRDGVDVSTLFKQHDAVHGKSSPNSAKESYEKGDAFTLSIFDRPDVTKTMTMKAEDGTENELDAMSTFIYKLSENQLNAGLVRFEMTVPEKDKAFTVTKMVSGSRPAKAPRLSMHGRSAVATLKKMLNKLTVAEMKKMYKAVKEVDPPASDKEELMLLIISLILPGYPYKHPYGSGSDDEFQDSQAPANAPAPSTQAPDTVESEARRPR